MDERLRDLICGSRILQRGNHSLRILSAREMLSCKREAEALCRNPEALGLWRNACILARAYCRGGMQVFPDGEAVLEKLSAEEIGREIAAYGEFSARVDVSCREEETAEEILAALRQEPMERIRWRVLRAFHVLPSEERAKTMTEGDYLYCALQLLLDREKAQEGLCPQCRNEEDRCRRCGKPLTGETAVNAGFDPSRFEELKRNG